MMSALRITRVIAKNLEIAAYAEKEAILPATLLPVLLKLFQYILGLANNQAPPPNISEMIKVIVKILWSCTTSNIPQVLCEDEGMANGWLEVLHATLRLPIHPSAFDDPKAEAWSCVKWVAHVVRRWMQLCAITDSLRPTDKPFSQLFLTWEPKFLEIIMQVVRSRHQGIHTPAKPFVVALEIVTLAIAKKKLYACFQSQIPTLIAENVFPELQFTQADAECWNNNPHEYIRRGNDPMSDIYNEKVVGMHLLEVLLVPTKKFHDKTLMGQFLQFLNSQLSTTDPARKHACLYVIANMDKHIRCHPASADHILEMLHTFVLPDLRSPYPYLRSMAFLVLSKFAKDLAKNEMAFTQSLSIGLDLLFCDTELPVRVTALSGLIRFLRRKESTVLIEPHLERIVFLCFQLMKEVDSEDIIATLERVVDKFGNHLASFTSQLCSTLVRHFMDIHQQWNSVSTTTDADFEDANFGQFESLATAADATLQTLCTLLVSVTHHKEVFASVQPIVAPLINKLLDPESIGYLDGALEVLSTVTFHARPLMTCIWEQFPMMHYVALNGGLDYFAHMLAPIDNFICADPDRFVQSNCVALMHEMCAAVLDLSREMNESEMIAAPKLMETLLQHCKPHRQYLDQYIPRYLDLVVDTLKSKDLFTDQFQLSMFHVILNSFWYNAELTMNYLAGRKLLDIFFRTYLGFLESVRKRLRCYDRKVSVLGLSSMMHMAKPQLVQQLQEICWGFITINHKQYLLEDEEIAKALAEDDDEDVTTTDEDEDSLSENDGEDDPEFWGTDSHHTSGGGGGGGTGKAGRVRYSQGIRVDNSQAQGDEEDMDEFEDEDYWTVLDEVCESVVFRDTLRSGNIAPPPDLDSICDYQVQRLQRRKEYENKVKSEAQSTREEYEAKLKQHR
jgi:hypothetical protein